MKRFIFLLGLGTLLFAQGDTVKIEIGKHGEKSAIAVPDLRGAGDAQPLMNTFNNTLWNELQGSGQLKMVPKTTYPLQIPQQPADFRPPANGKSQGPWLSDWSGPPVNTNYLAFGYTATQNNQLVLYGWVYDVKQAAPSSAQASAPKNEATPAKIQTPRISTGVERLRATKLGTRKIPPPITTPTTMASASTNPSDRGSSAADRALTLGIYLAYSPSQTPPNAAYAEYSTPLQSAPGHPPGFRPVSFGDEPGEVERRSGHRRWPL